jgi:TrmH family RNA methyltransferase
MTGAAIRSLVVCPEMAGADALEGRGDLHAPIIHVNDAVMKSLADTETPQGVLAVVDLPEPVLPALDGRRSLVLVVDGVRDPGNVGTLIRTAAAAGCAAVVTTAGAADAFSPKVVRAAMGMHFHVPVVADVSWDWLGPALSVLPAIYGTDMAGAVPYDGVDWNVGAALVIGHEDHGLSDEARAWCRTTVAIPMAPGVESLNAAVSGAVILFEATRQRRAARRT